MEGGHLPQAAPVSSRGMKIPLETERPHTRNNVIWVLFLPTISPAAEEVVDYEEEPEGGEVVRARRVVQQAPHALLRGLEPDGAQHVVFTCKQVSEISMTCPHRRYSTSG